MPDILPVGKLKLDLGLGKKGKLQLPKVELDIKKWK